VQTLRIALAQLAPRLGELDENLERHRAILQSARKQDAGLVVFPEGEVLNFLSGRRNPLRHKLYIRGYLTEENEGEVLEGLREARPAAIVIGRRRTSEYGASRFGSDYAVRIGAWIAGNYVPFLPDGGVRGRMSAFDYYFRR
jgi:predicted amidohydrolase